MVKGAPEKVMDMCTSVLIKGKHIPIQKEERAELEKLNENLAKRGERVLAMAYLKLPAD